MRKLILISGVCLSLALSAIAAEPQAADLKVSHRAGQTFITFKEVDRHQISTDIDTDAIKKMVRELNEKKLHHRIYRSSNGIDSVEGWALLVEF